MRKSVVWLGAWMMSAACVCADPIPYGTRELVTKAQWSEAGPDGSALTMEGAVGYFVKDNIELGISAGLSRNDTLNTWNAGVFAEYHLDTNSRLVPFVGASAKYQRTDITETTVTENETVLETVVITVTDNTSEGDNGEGSANLAGGKSVESGAATPPQITRSTSNSTTTTTTETTTDAVVLEGRAGLKFFVSKSLAISAAFVYAVASEDIFYDGAETSASDQRVELGMRYYF